MAVAGAQTNSDVWLLEKFVSKVLVLSVDEPENAAVGVAVVA